MFVDDLAHPALDDGDRHHLQRVLRLRAGDRLTVSDGAGRWRTCRFGDDLEAIDDPVTLTKPTPPVSVAFSLLKGDRTEWVIQKLTELGVDRIVPFVAERSVARWEPSRAEQRMRRYERVAREAAMQSRRCWVPQISVPTSFSDLAARSKLVLCQKGGEPPQIALNVVAVGPEGGWTDTELAAADHTMGLGEGVLRAETAAIVAGVLLTALRSASILPRNDVI